MHRNAIARQELDESYSDRRFVYVSNLDCGQLLVAANVRMVLDEQLTSEKLWDVWQKLVNLVLRL